MKVKMKVLGAGPNGIIAVNSIREVSNEEGKYLIGKSYAVEAPSSAKVTPSKEELELASKKEAEARKNQAGIDNKKKGGN